MADDRGARLALVGAAVVAVRTMTPAYIAVGSMDTESDAEAIKAAWDAAENAITALREFADHCSALTPN